MFDYIVLQNSSKNEKHVLKKLFFKEKKYMFLLFLFQKSKLLKQKRTNNTKQSQTFFRSLGERKEKQWFEAVFETPNWVK